MPLAQNFVPKSFLNRIINEAIENLPDAIDIDRSDAVVVTGVFGEKAAVFFPQTEGIPPGVDSKVGFFIASKNEPGKHLNMNRAAAGALVGLLVTAFDLKVTTETVPVTTYETRTVVK